jgi:hypothetical protein
MAKKTIQKIKARAAQPYIEASHAICTCFTLPKDEGKAPDAEMVQLQAESFSPFEEGDYACGCEILGQTDDSVHYLAVIASEERLAAQPWYPTLKSRHQLGRCRIDISVLAWRTILLEKEKMLREGRHFVFLQTAEEILFMVFVEGTLKGLHAFSASEADEDPSTMTRELSRFLALLNVWNIQGLSSAKIYAPSPADALALKALIKDLGIFETIDDILLPEATAAEWLVQGLAKREAAKATMDLTPQSWREMAKKAQRRHMAIFGGLLLALAWGACAAYFVLAPLQKEQELAALRAEYNALGPKYNEYLTLRNRLELIERYQDRSNSALEILRLVCEAKPKGVTFLSLNFQQKNIIKISANAETTADVYAFKEALEKVFAVDPQDEACLRPPATPEIVRFVEDRKTGLQRIDVDVKFALVEEDE